MRLVERVEDTQYTYSFTITAAANATTAFYSREAS